MKSGCLVSKFAVSKRAEAGAENLSAAVQTQRSV